MMNQKELAEYERWSSTCLRPKLIEALDFSEGDMTKKVNVLERGVALIKFLAGKKDELKQINAL